MKFWATAGTTQNDTMEELSSKETPGSSDSWKFTKTDLELTKQEFTKHITEQEFRIIVIKWITGLEKSIEGRRESIATEIKGLRNSHEELKSVINEVQNKLEAAIERIQESEERTGELEDKIMEKVEAEKRD